MRQVPFAPHEWYHCYTRTIDKSRPFEEDADTVERFLETLYLANSIAPMPHIVEIHKQYSHEEIFTLHREHPLVAIGGYCIMPTHYHLLLQPITDSGISEFMHKLGTGFTRFYNDRNRRVGNLFVKPFRSKHIHDDRYLRRVSQYIHLNPVELFESKWKQGIVNSKIALEKQLLSYPYSSLLEYEGMERPQSSILNMNSVHLIGHDKTDTRTLIKEMAEYYQFLELDL